MELTPNKRVQQGDDGDVLIIRDTLNAGSGNQFVVVSSEDNALCGLIPVADFRDGDSEWQEAPDKEDAVTDEPGVTGDRDEASGGESPTDPRRDDNRRDRDEQDRR